MNTLLTFAPVTDAVAARFPKSSVVSTVADFAEIGPAAKINTDASFLHLERVAGVSPAIAAKHPRPFEDLLDIEAGFSSINNNPGDSGFSYAVFDMGILNLERLAGVTPDIDARFPERRAA